MRILLIMDPGIPVPPVNYGGIERIVALLAEEYLKLGHRVDLLASEGSFVQGCRLYPIGKDGFPPSKKNMKEAVKVAWKFLTKNKCNYDLIQNFGRLIYLLPVVHNRVKKIMCYQREITRKNIILFTSIPNRNLIFSGCSADLIRRGKLPGKWHPVYNGVRFTDFTLEQTVVPEAPLMFLGRIERIKGCHTAIEICKKIKKSLIIAGNISTLPEEKQYFEKEILPQIDGEMIQYVGEVNDSQKIQLLKRSKALLMPIEWNEPFGIVMIEAMACGTPVIGFNKGAVGEVIDQDITGFKVENKNEMAESILKLDSINRKLCREQAQKRFDISIIASEYLTLHSN